LNVLWYKAWLETRSRFLASLCVVTSVVVLAVHHEEYVLSPVPERDTYQLLFFVHHYLMGLWMLCVVLLGMGGLIRERAAGASSYTLALPVSRVRLVAIQVAVGLLEAIGLAVIPWAAILLTTAIKDRPFPLSQAVFYVLLLISGGLVYFALSVLISSLLEGEYTAPAVAYGIMILSGVICANSESLRPYADLWRFMGGNNHFNDSTYLLSGPFPWLGALAGISVTAFLLLASVGVVYRRDF
jgi:ABC-2 type transport system permease protein